LCCSSSLSTDPFEKVFRKLHADSVPASFLPGWSPFVWGDAFLRDAPLPLVEGRRDREHKERERMRYRDHVREKREE
jgi:hypothetical protein